MTIRKMTGRLALATVLLAATATAALAQTAQPERRQVGNLVFDGVPQIPAYLRPQLQRYRNARGAGFAGFMADGSILITTRFGETPQLHRVAAPGADRRQLTFFTEPVGGATVIPGTNRYAYARDTGGAEYFQIYLAEAGQPEVALTEAGARNQGFVVTPDGKTAYWAQVRPGQSVYEIIAADLDRPGERRVVYRGEGSWSAADVSDDGRTLLMGHYISIEESQLWTLDLASGQATQIRPGAGKIAYGGGQLTPDGRTVITTSDEGSDFRRLVEISLADGSVTPLTEGMNWDVDGVTLSEDGRLMAYVVNEDGYSRLHIRDRATGRALPQPDLPIGLVGGLEFSQDGSTLGMSLSTPLSSGDVWTWNVEQGGLTRWTESEVGPLDASTFVTPDLIHVRSFDGLSVPAFVYRPRGVEGRRPVIIDIHGGPESQARPGFNTTYQQWVADLGAVVIVPNVRGSTGYGKTYVSLDNGPLREDSVKDIGAILDWIATQPDLDPSRVVVSGGSYGGYMVLASMAHYADRLAGGIDIVGISSWTTFLQNTEGYRRDNRRAEYGDERDPEMRALFDRISPLNMTDRMTRPLMVVQGANDPRVPRSEAEQVVAAVRGHDRPVWYLLAMDEGHGFRKKSNIDSQVEVTNMFLRQVFNLPLEPAAGAR